MRAFSTCVRTYCPRLSPFANSYEQLATLTPSTITRMQKVYSNKCNPLHHVEIFQSTITHSDGSKFTIKTSIPLNPRINLVKDTLIHPLWNPRIQESQVASNSEEYMKFKKRFDVGSPDDEEEDILAALSVDSSGQSAVVFDTAVQTKPAATTGKKKKK